MNTFLSSDPASQRQQLENFLALSPAAIAILGIEGHVKILTPSFTRILGYTEQDIPHMDAFWQLAFPDPVYRENCRAQWQAALQQALSQQTMLHNFEARVRCKHGEYLWLEAHASFSESEIYIMLVDMSQRKQAQDETQQLADEASALRLETAWLHLALESSHSGTWEWVPESDTHHWSPNTWRLFGLEANLQPPHFELWEALIHPDDHFRITRCIQNAVHEQREFMDEYRIVVNGEERWLFVRGCPLPQQPPKPLRYLGILMDITDRKQVELNLRERELVMSTITAQAGDAIEITDAETLRFMEFNQVGPALLGYSREEYAELSVFDIQADIDPVNLRRLVKDLKPGREKRFETQHRCKDGRLLDVQVSLRPIELHGRPYCVAIWGDISTRKQLEARTHLAETRFKTLLDQAAPDAIFIHDFQGQLIEVNRTACQSVGYSREELLNMSVLDIDKNFDFASAQALWAAVKPGETRILQGMHRRKNGEVFPVEVHFGKMTWGEQTLLIGIARDITQRLTDEAALRHSEKRFHDIVNVSADWIWEVDLEGQFTYVSNSIEDILGYSAETILGRTLFDLMPPEEAGRIKTIFNDFVSQGLDFRDLLNTNRHQDGSIRYIQTSGTPIIDPQGQIMGYRGLDRDVTELVIARQALEEHQQQLEALVAERTATALATKAQLELILASSADGIFGADANGHITFVNTAAQHLLGYSTEALIGRPIHQTLHHSYEDGSNHPSEACPIQRCLRENQQVRVDDDVFWRSDGSYLPVSYAAHPMLRDGQVIGLVINFSDNTRRKAFEAALREREDNLKEAQRIAHLGSWYLNISSGQVIWSEELYHMYRLDPELPVPNYSEHERLFTPDSWQKLASACSNGENKRSISALLMPMPVSVTA